jgi:hypothetical protein
MYPGSHIKNPKLTVAPSSKVNNMLGQTLGIHDEHQFNDGDGGKTRGGCQMTLIIYSAFTRKVTNGLTNGLTREAE